MFDKVICDREEGTHASWFWLDSHNAKGKVQSLSVAFQLKLLPERNEFALKHWRKNKAIVASQYLPMSSCTTSPTISLRLLALILCSNCSNTFNKVLTSKWRHTVKLLFETSGHHFSLLKMFHGWSKHFTSRYDPSTPFTPLHPQTTTASGNPGLRCGGQKSTNMYLHL